MPTTTPSHMQCTRFAPSTTGQAHPGTLMSALLCWLDARQRGAEIYLRLEDLDPQRCTPALADAMIEALDWFGLDFDRIQRQSDLRPQHEALMQRYAEAGLLYSCDCSRARIKALGVRGADGGFVYDGHCRDNLLNAENWQTCDTPIRLQLPNQIVELVDEGGLDLSQTPATDIGDPVVRRRDGAYAYHLASVADDLADGMTYLIRGRDLASSAATQWLMFDLIGEAQPTLRHHALLLEPHGDKFAKFHQAVGVDALRDVYSPEQLCGALAHWIGLIDHPEPVTPQELIDGFDWAKVATEDIGVRYDGERLHRIDTTQ